MSLCIYVCVRGICVAFCNFIIHKEFIYTLIVGFVYPEEEQESSLVVDYPKSLWNYNL